MPASATDLAILSSPLPVPAPLGQAPGTAGYAGGFSPAQQAMAGGLTGANPSAITPNMPFGAGGTMYPGPMFATEDIANVGGVTGTAPMEDKSVVIPEVPDPVDIQAEEFMEAHEEGGKPVAREARREDRAD